MSSSVSKISALQLGSALFISRLFSEAMSFPVDVTEYSMSRFTAVFTAKVILFALFLPLLFLAKKNPGENVITAIIKKSRVLAWAEGIFLTIVLFVSFSATFEKLDYYATSTIFGKAPTLLLVTAITAVCGYGIWKGIETVVRVGSAVSAIFIVFVVGVIFAVSGLFNFDFFYPVLIEDGGRFIKEIGDELSKNTEILIFAVLMSYVKDKPHRTVYFAVPAIAFFIELLIFAETAVFGPYLNKLNFPFYVLSALSDIVLFQRLDGIDVVVWILTCIIKLSLYGLSVRTIFDNLAGKKVGNIAAAAFTVLAACLFWFTQNRPFANALNSGVINIITLSIGGTIVPLIILLITRKKKKRKNSADTA